MAIEAEMYGSKQSLPLARLAKVIYTNQVAAMPKDSNESAEGVQKWHY